MIGCGAGWGLSPGAVEIRKVEGEGEGSGGLEVQFTFM